MSSVIVAKQGQGDMAVSNALGSNIFDILLGIGVPFMISSKIYNQPVPVNTDGIISSMILLLIVLIMVVSVLKIANWNLTSCVGKVLFFIYILYIIFVSIYSM